MLPHYVTSQNKAKPGLASSSPAHLLCPVPFCGFGWLASLLSATSVLSLSAFLTSLSSSRQGLSAPPATITLGASIMNAGFILCPALCDSQNCSFGVKARKKKNKQTAPHHVITESQTLLPCPPPTSSFPPGSSSPLIPSNFSHFPPAFLFVS